MNGWWRSVAAQRGGHGAQLTLFEDPQSGDSGMQPGEQLSPMERMVAELNQSLRDAGWTVVENDPSHTWPSVMFNVPLPARPPSPEARRFAMSDTELGKWWLDHARYSISFEPFDDGKPGFVLIDRQTDFIIWARQGKFPCMQFGDWKAAVRGAMAWGERKTGPTP